CEAARPGSGIVSRGACVNDACPMASVEKCKLFTALTGGAAEDGMCGFCGCIASKHALLDTTVQHDTKVR
ncbi:hypothetical protein, partial [Escherichia coli]|uniref:hypothetical protein n=1 Tax=Escherichia coli TaxID=562 RepID=UPI001BCA0BC8